MTTYDGGLLDLYIQVDVRINGSWVEVTSRAEGGRAATGVTIERGPSGDALDPETSRCELTLGNADGYLTEGNPFSPLAGFGRGCEIRVQRFGVVAFQGRIYVAAASYPGGPHSTVTVLASGSLGGDLDVGDEPLRSAMYRSLSGTTAGDIQPRSYWSMEDGRSSTVLAAVTDGTLDATFAGDVSLAASSSLVGSDPLPTLAAGGTVRALVPTYTDTGRWMLVWVMRIADLPVVDTTYAEIRVQGSTIVRWVVGIQAGSPAFVTITGYDSGGSLVKQLVPLNLDNIGGAAGFEDAWLCYGLGVQDVGGGSCDLVAGATLAGDVPYIDIDSQSMSPGRPQRVTYTAPADMSVGHLTFYTDASMLVANELTANVDAMTGWNGETVESRLARLAREEGLTLTLTGTATARMGPQGTGTLADAFADCQGVDLGLLSDGGSAGGVDYRCLSSIYNQAAGLAVLQGSLTPDVAPIWDHRHIRNDVTVSRPGGSSSRQVDTDHIALIQRRVKGGGPAAAYADAQVPHLARWQLNTGTGRGPRYQAVTINLRNSDGRHLADAVLGLAIGDRMTVAETALPPQHPPGGIDGLVIGWREVIDADTWTFAPRVLPYAPYLVGVYADDPGGTVSRYGIRDSKLLAAVDADDTNWRVVTSHADARWVTGSSTPVFPVPIQAGLVAYNATAIGSLVVDGMSGAVSGWATADGTGQTWSTVGGSASDYSKAGGRGLHSLGVVNSARSTVIESGLLDTDVSVSCQVSVLATGGYISWGLLARHSAATTNYQARVEMTPGGTIRLSVFRQLAGAFTSLKMATILRTTHNTGFLYRARLQVVGTAPARLRAKIWRVSAGEPDLWDIDIEDDAPLTSPGAAGCRSSLESTNTNALPVVISYDTFEVSNPQAFTITRLPTDRAHAVDSPVTVYVPGRYALGED